MNSVKAMMSSKYSYLIIIVVIILVALILYYIWPRNQVNNTGPANAPIQRFTQVGQEVNQVDLGEIILYYASWCGHSRAFLPEWAKFKDWAKTNLPGLKVTEIKCEDENEELCKQREIGGFPTVIFYPKNKNIIKFMKERSMQKLIEFVNENK
ncbi:MAG: thioredoxin [Barrevirus sp.]|uniref:Thioredoxin n=1 Tax=Barrevirus sp. TaxID=2487763 RepID=A0A3G4ZQK2_9VIRU|nr:MAG: thioredoxin [Barrevirus sp.]